MRGRFLSGLILMLLLNFLVKPFYIIGIEAEVQNQLGSSTYGLYFALLNLSFLFNILLDVGINNFNTKNIAETPALIGKQMGMLFGLRGLLFIIYAIITFASGWLLGYGDISIKILLWLVANQFLVATLQFLRSNFAGLHLFKWDSVFSVLDRLLLIIFCSILLWSNFIPFEFTIFHFIAAQSLAYLIAVISAFIVIQSVSGKIGIRVKKLFSMAVFRKSWPYALLILLMMFYNRVDGIMLERLPSAGAKEAGYYAQGFRLFEAVNMVALIFAGLLLPIFARMLQNREDVNNMVALAAKILIPGGLIIAVSCFFYRTEIITARYDDVQQHSIIAFGILMLSALPVFLTYIYGTLLTAKGSMNVLNLTAAIGITANVVLNYSLIPHYGAWGAAIATIATQSLTALVQFILAVKKLRLGMNFSVVLRCLLLVGVMLSIVYALNHFSLNWWMGFIAVIFSGVGFCLLTRLWNIPAILTLIKSSNEE